MGNGFRMSPEKMKEPISRFKNASEELRVDGNELLNIANSLDASYVMMVPMLESLSKRTFESSDKMRKLGDGLEIITKCYVDAEECIKSYQKNQSTLSLAINANGVSDNNADEALKTVFDLLTLIGASTINLWPWVRYYREVKEQKGEKLEQLQEHLNDEPPRDWSEIDYTEEIDEWIKEKEKEFDELYEAAMNSGNGIDPKALADLYLKFYIAVRTDGPMDIKKANKWEDAFGFPSPSNSDYPYFLYHGQVMDPGTLGNVIYAYVGAKYFPEMLLYLGGAAVQTKRRFLPDIMYTLFLPHFGDMPEDAEAIRLGIKWREEGLPD